MSDGLPQQDHFAAERAEIRKIRRTLWIGIAILAAGLVWSACIVALIDLWLPARFLAVIGGGLSVYALLLVVDVLSSLSDLEFLLDAQGSSDPKEGTNGG